MAWQARANPLVSQSPIVAGWVILLPKSRAVCARGAIKSMASLVSRIGTEPSKLLEVERLDYVATFIEET